MPWRIEQRSGKYCVIKETDGSTEKCHPTEAEARAHMRALYANEGQAAGGRRMRDLEFASFGVELAQVQAKGQTLSGYASVFDYPIDESAGTFERTTFVRPGAFARTIKNNAEDIQVLFNHGRDPRYGKLPIGRLTDIHEDKRGLWVSAELHDGPDNENIKAALASGALRAMSIQFETLDEDFNEDRTQRNLRELRLHELGPVTFPANKAATASLHSLDGLTQLPELQAQPAPPSEEARESTPLDEARRTWEQQQAVLTARFSRIFKEG